MLVLLAGVFWSLQGPTVRMIETASGPQIVFWRSIGQLVVMLGVVAIVNRGRVLSAFRLAGYRAVVGGLCNAAAGTCFVLAVLQTTVANVVFILASAPLIAAAGAWLLLRERIEPRTLGAMIAAVIGIAVMMSEGFATGNLTGALLALVATFGFAGIAVVARWGGGLNMLPAVCIGAAFTIVAGWTMAGGDVAVTVSDRLYAFASGGLLTATGATLFLYGAKFVPGRSARLPHADRGGARPDLGLGRVRRNTEHLHAGRWRHRAGCDFRRSCTEGTSFQSHVTVPVSWWVSIRRSFERDESVRSGDMQVPLTQLRSGRSRPRP